MTLRRDKLKPSRVEKSLLCWIATGNRYVCLKHLTVKSNVSTQALALQLAVWSSRGMYRFEIANQCFLPASSCSLWQCDVARISFEPFVKLVSSRERCKMNVAETFPWSHHRDKTHGVVKASKLGILAVVQVMDGSTMWSCWGPCMCELDMEPELSLRRHLGELHCDGHDD